MDQTTLNTSSKPEKSLKYRILIVSSIEEDWGGSEELWAQTIPTLQESGFKVFVIKNRINRDHPKFLSLQERGVVLEDLIAKSPKKKPVLNRISNLYKKLTRKNFKGEEFVWPFTKKMLNINPDLVIVSQGINFDGLGSAFQCSKHNVPYVVVSQKAVDFYWPEFYNRPHMIHALQHAEKCYFVSNHNLVITEEQFGLRLNNALVVHNPVKISNGIIPYPALDKTYNLACIGRLFVLDKGQDILLRVLAMEKWKGRNVKVSFIGTGGDTEGLQAMAKLLDVKNVEFLGQVDDIENLWRNFHALVLPSRSEGLPLAMIEAMAAGRPVIVSNAGGNAEVIEDGINGFIGLANEESFDAAMERAWNKREEWQQIGLKGSQYVEKNIPKYPEREFAGYVLKVLDEIALR